MAVPWKQKNFSKSGLAEDLVGSETGIEAEKEYQVETVKNAEELLLKIWTMMGEEVHDNISADCNTV